MARRPRYSAEFKAQAVRMVLEDGRKVCEVASCAALSFWTIEVLSPLLRAGSREPVGLAADDDRLTNKW